MKRWLSMLLSAVMLLSLLPTAVLAVDQQASLPNGGDVDRALLLYWTFRDEHPDEHTNMLEIDKSNERDQYALSGLYYAKGKTLLSLFEDGTEQLACGYLIDTSDSTNWVSAGTVTYYPGSGGGSKEVMLEFDRSELTVGTDRYLLMIRCGEQWYKHYVTVTDGTQGGGHDGGVLEMRCPDRGTFATAFQLDAGVHRNVELRVGDSWLNGEARSKLTYGGAVTALTYTPVIDRENKVVYLWTLTLTETENGHTDGWIQYTDGDSTSKVTISLRPSHGGAVDPEDVVAAIEFPADDAAAFTWKGQTYYLGVSDLFQRDGSWVEYFLGLHNACDLVDDSERCGFLFDAQAFTRGEDGSYTAVSAETRAKMKEDYTFTLALQPTKNCSYYPFTEPDEESGRTHYAFTLKNCGNWVLLATAAPKNGGAVISQRAAISIRRASLMMNCSGSGFKSSLALTAGVYEDVELRFGGSWLNGEALTSGKLTFGGAVTALTYKTVIDQENNEVYLWTITVAETEGGLTEGKGWIRYDAGNGTSSQVDITLIPSHDRKVTDADRLSYQNHDGTIEFILDGKVYSENVVPFTWDGAVYYLAACEWGSTLLGIQPKGNGSRALAKGSNEDMHIAARIFQLVTGTAGSEDAHYRIREDIRAEMENRGYSFRIVPHPVEGNRNYPVSETVDMKCLSSDDGWQTSQWLHLYYGSPETAGWWAFEAQKVKAERVEERCFCSEKYLYMATEPVDLSGCGVDVGQINHEIAAVLARFAESDGYTMQSVEFTLAPGTIEGEIVIPGTNCFVNLCGAGARRGEISTTIRGGVKLEGADCDFMAIHFVGAGKDRRKTADGRQNSAVYGFGEGIPRTCILENYWSAVTSEDRPVWGSTQSIFRNNHIGIHMTANDNGGNLQMLGNWFVGNDIALQVDECPMASLQNESNRFVGNGYDMINNSGMDLWISQNFFYHGILWEPQLWKEEDGVLHLNYSGDYGSIRSLNPRSEYIFSMVGNYNRKLLGDPLYLSFLPVVDGSSRTFAMPLARSEACDSFFYPKWCGHLPRWWTGWPFYPNVVPKMQTVEQAALDAGVSVYTEDNGRLYRFDFNAETGN